MKINLISKKEQEQLDKIRELYWWFRIRTNYNSHCGVVTAEEAAHCMRVMSKGVQHGIRR